MPPSSIANGAKPPYKQTRRTGMAPGFATGWAGKAGSASTRPAPSSKARAAVGTSLGSEARRRTARDGCSCSSCLIITAPPIDFLMRRTLACRDGKAQQQHEHIAISPWPFDLGLLGVFWVRYDEVTMAPTRANGKICYLDIPATDIGRSSAFYEAVFGWQTRRRGDGALAFDDSVGEVGGSWVTGRPPSSNPSP